MPTSRPLASTATATTPAGTARKRRFTGQEQRESYEVRKDYIWQARVLCAECFATRMQIEAELVACAHRWQTARSECNADTPFLRRWHGLLQQHVDYGGSRDEGNIHMLLALLRGREC